MTDVTDINVSDYANAHGGGIQRQQVASPAANKVARRQTKSMVKPMMTVGGIIAAGAVGYLMFGPKAPSEMPGEITTVGSAMRKIADQRVKIGSYNPATGEMDWSAPKSVKELNDTATTDIVMVKTKSGDFLTARFDSKGDSRFFAIDAQGHQSMTDTPSDLFKLPRTEIADYAVVRQVNGQLGVTTSTGLFEPGVPTKIVGFDVERAKGAAVVNVGTKTLRISTKTAEVYFPGVNPAANGPVVKRVDNNPGPR